MSKMLSGIERFKRCLEIEHDEEKNQTMVRSPLSGGCGCVAPCMPITSREEHQLHDQ